MTYLHCTAQTNRTLQSDYRPIKKINKMESKISHEKRFYWDVIVKNSSENYEISHILSYAFSYVNSYNNFFFQSETNAFWRM